MLIGQSSPLLFKCKSGKKCQKKSGAQHYRCNTCGKQFQHEYFYWGADQKNKYLISRMLIRRSGIRDIANILTISTGWVLRVLLSYTKVELKPRNESYHRVQVDELHSFVQSKKKKVWILYAYCAQTKEILGLTMGKRSRKTVKDLFKRLKDIDVNFWCNDAWKAFQEVFSPQKT